ncbi:MAG TPA: bifunctional diaminohydroxyphosphoribosylaminopyrimidine deaminase/5-amino-6-(5-phosphoribosylamino)uracil reductase RibD [Gammaproteobacteria bacterium]|nr:bifunctional diaminohydroxyphosphoribosylaminopyrimidine deaminase/5-amino-6-(5-phosphoribosylamino)uracil reductase RibD [Gammaproteobacteria bacterium]
MNDGGQRTITALDHRWMAHALQLAAKGLYDTAPNPTVGCVLVNDDRLIAAGWTAPAGGAHAERVALAAAGARARGATAYVTLEPCCHQGRTGPCTQALIAAGVARVVYAVRDPNPRVDGAGVRELQQAGIRVDGGVLEQAAERLNRGFFARMRRARPWVRTKLAASLDGRTALANGTSQWITGDAARRDVHRWRARSSAILTGSGTILKDDPALTARLEDPAIDVLQPLRVIVDSQLRTPPTAKTLALPGEVLVFTNQPGGPAQQALEAAGARIERVSGAPHCDLTALLARLAELQINDVWVEAGPKLNGALLQSGLIDELVLYFAPRLLGDSALGMFGVAALTSLDQGWTLQVDEVRRLGDDLRIIARPSRVAAP